MQQAPETKRLLTADEIDEMADRGEDVSGFTLPMLQELDQWAAELNISRQAVIKSLLRQALDHHYLARKASCSDRDTSP